MKKRRMYYVVLSLMVLVLAACVPAQAPAPTDDADTDSAAPAPPASDAVDITYTYASRGIPQDLQIVQDALNEILIPEIGVNLTLEPIDFGAYNDKMQLRLAAGEECDVMFTAPWTNSYSNNVANGVLHPLDELLPTRAPGLWASMPASTWEAARVDGHIYGVINQQIFPKPWGVHVRKDLLDKYGFSLDEVTRWEDMEPFLIQLRDEEGITPVYSDEGRGSSLWRTGYWGYVEMPGAVTTKADDKDMRVISVLDTAEFKEAADIAKRWVDEGYFLLEPPPADEASSMFSAGLFGMSYHVEKPGNDVEAQNRWGWEFVSKNLTDPLILDTGGATATLSAICATSKNPEKAMLFLEMLNTDVDVYNLLSRGIQGKHWDWVDEENKVMGFPEGTTSDTSSYNPNTDWMFGNQFNAYYRDAKQVGAWEATKAMNDGAFPATTLGFTVSPGPIETELAQVNAVWEEYVRPIEWGYVSYDEGVAEARQQLENAGIAKVIEEVQAQIDAWAEANGKK